MPGYPLNGDSPDRVGEAGTAARHEITDGQSFAAGGTGSDAAAKPDVLDLGAGVAK